MKEIVLENITQIEEDVLNNSTLEKLTIKDSIVSIPTGINRLSSLKELKLINNTITHIPAEFIDLEQTFVFFEGNKPDFIQQTSLLLFDLQWKKITKSQAVLYLKLLQNDISKLTKEAIGMLVEALNYRVETVCVNSMRLLDDFLPLSSIPEKSEIAIIGEFTKLSLVDIKHRLDNLSLSYQTKITSKTTHIVLCNEPDLKGVDMNTEVRKITTERNFLTWLNTVDKQFLGEKTEENKDALENVSQMLLSNDDQHIELALQMMKTHGVSKELLSSLFIFFHRCDYNKKYVRKVKGLFKKYAPRELIAFLNENKRRHGNSLEIDLYNKKFYAFLKETPCMDGEFIALHFNKGVYFDIVDCSKKKIETLFKMMNNGVLDISMLYSIPEEVKELKDLKTLIYSDYDWHKPKRFLSEEWIADLAIEKLDLYKSNLDLPSTFVNFKNLKHLALPYDLKHFPAVVTKMQTLEVLEMRVTQFVKIPEEIKVLRHLREVHLYGGHENDFDRIKKERAHLFPEHCIITRANKRQV